jgi:NTP pyrophosphatase (non-canonical NTP hydrolase)
MSMQYKDFLYMKLAEEAGEIAQMAIKTAIFGEDSTDPTVINGDTNQVALAKELTDLIAVFSLLNEQLDPSGKTQPYDIDEERLEQKRIKLKTMFSQMQHQRLKG